MASAAELAKDPDFLGLPNGEKMKVLQTVDPDFGGLPAAEQMKVVTSLSRASAPVATAEPSPAEGMGRGAKFLTGIGGGLLRAGYGIGQGASALSEAMGQEPDVPSAEYGRKAKEVRETLEPLGGWGTAGRVVGEAAPSLLLPAGRAATIPGKIGVGMAQGAAVGASQPVEEGESRAMNTAIGGAVGGGAAGLLEAGRPLVRVGQELLGTLTGTGKGAVELATHGSKPFADAMRGKISGEEVVANAKDALRVVMAKRGDAYRAQLAEIKAQTGPIDITPIKDRARKLLPEYVRIDKGTGLPDWSRTTVGDKAAGEIREVLKRVEDWGSQADDFTPEGVDMLKRQLDDFYSDSSKARAFVADLRKEVANTLERQVPGYREMTKGYSEATNLIKDIEKGLSLGKSGMNGRVTADQTLRRLTSALRENFEMRKDLLEALGTESGAAIPEQVAGVAMSQWLPRGAMGKFAAGGVAYASYLNPKLWPMLVASSPRVVGEFLNTFGQAARLYGKTPVAGIPSAVGRAVKPYVPRALALGATVDTGNTGLLRPEGRQ